MQQDGDIEMFTKCRPIINHQLRFICKNIALKLTYCPCCKDRWYGTELKPGISMCGRCDKSKKSHPHICDFSEENDCDPFL